MNFASSKSELVASMSSSKKQIKKYLNQHKTNRLRFVF